MKALAKVLMGCAVLGVAALFFVPKRLRVLRLLRSLSNKPRVISGQHLDQGYDSVRIGEIHALTGKWVGMVSADYWGAGSEEYPGYVRYSASNQALISHWKKGGLVSVTLACGAPGKYRAHSSQSDRDVDFEVLKDPSSDVHADFLDMLSMYGDGLEELQNNGVVVLLRPFQEMQYEWPWWGDRAQLDYVWLWEKAYDYFVRERRLRNLIWVYSPGVHASGAAGNDFLYYYPGDQVVDVVSFTMFSLFDGELPRDAYDQLVALGKPFGIAEIGPGNGSLESIPERFDNLAYIDAVRSWYSASAFFMVWQDAWGIQAHEHAEELLSDEWVANRGDF